MTDVSGDATTSTADGDEAILDTVLEYIAEVEAGERQKCYSTLLKVLGNIIDSPMEEKFRRIKPTVPALAFKGARNILMAIGFREDQEDGGRYIASPAIDNVIVRVRDFLAAESDLAASIEQHLIELVEQRDNLHAEHTEYTEWMKEEATINNGISKLQLQLEALHIEGVPFNIPDMLEEYTALMKEEEEGDEHRRKTELSIGQPFEQDMQTLCDFFKQARIHLMEDNRLKYLAHASGSSNELPSAAQQCRVLRAYAGEACIICFELLHDEQVVELPCKHIWHKVCSLCLAFHVKAERACTGIRMPQTPMSCPMCRQPAYGAGVSKEGYTPAIAQRPLISFEQVKAALANTRHLRNQKREAREGKPFAGEAQTAESVRRKSRMARISYMITQHRLERKQVMLVVKNPDGTKKLMTFQSEHEKLMFERRQRTILNAERDREAGRAHEQRQQELKEKETRQKAEEKAILLEQVEEERRARSNR